MVEDVHTSKNTHNPSNPPVTVRPGLNTTDEMFLIYFHYLPYQTGDEDRDIEALTTLGVNELESIRIVAYPNPAQNKIHFSVGDLSYQSLQIRIYDVNGKVLCDLQKLQSDSGDLIWDIPENLANGQYYYSINMDGKIGSGPISVVR